LRAVDILGLAMAVMIGLLTQIVEPRSTPWWIGVSISGLIGTITLTHIIWNDRDRIKTVLGSRVGLVLCSLTIVPIGVLGFIVSVGLDLPKTSSEAMVAEQTTGALPQMGLQPLYSGSLQSVYGKFLFQCNVGPPTPEAAAKYPQMKEVYKNALEVWGDVMGASLSLSDIRGGYRIALELNTDEAKAKWLDAGCVESQRPPSRCDESACGL
jgi:hypothetical protein